MQEQRDKQRPQFWLREFSVVFDANAALVEVFGASDRGGHEVTRLAYVNGVEDLALAVDDVVVPEVFGCVVRGVDVLGLVVYYEVVYAAHFVKV